MIWSDCSGQQGFRGLAILWAASVLQNIFTTIVQGVRNTGRQPERLDRFWFLWVLHHCCFYALAWQEPSSSPVLNFKIVAETIFGRFSSEALVVTYEGSRIEDQDCYLSERLRPLQPLLLWGRTAAQEPSVKKEEAVWYWWKDVARQRH